MTALHQTSTSCRFNTSDMNMRLSLYEEAWREVDVHKWIESERHGRDLGEMAIRDWWRRYWPHYCRRKRLEHIRGMNRFREFGDEAFGCIYSLIVTGDALVEAILDQIDAGRENLCIINWAMDYGIPTDRVIDILEQIDVNRARLDPAI